MKHKQDMSEEERIRQNRLGVARMFFGKNGLRVIELEGREAGRYGIRSRDGGVTVLVDSIDELNGWLRGVGMVLDGKVVREDGKIELNV